MALTPKIKDLSVLSPNIDASKFFEVKCSYTAGGLLEYVGFTEVPNASDSALVWFIIKLTYDGSGNLLRKRLPDLGQHFNYAWTSRATYFT